MEVLDLVARLIDARPLSQWGVERLTGVRLREDLSTTNPYFTILRSVVPRAPVRSVELRLPLPEASRRDGLVIVDFDPAAVSLRQPDLTARFGARFKVEFPNAHQPPNSPRYQIYTYPWGDLRLGLGQASGRLECVVVDAER
ncbi:MAG TPA: hypothetical protein VGS22_17380 [Thermoanaerobaculia bacterium]|jgi:hypothetical protein|nr:hypothetical protein [Thermoanaerobaculia bacterium]